MDEPLFLALAGADVDVLVDDDVLEGVGDEDGALEVSDPFPDVEPAAESAPELDFEAAAALADALESVR